MSTNPEHIDSELLARYAADELDETQSATVEDHLVGCAGCVRRAGRFALMADVARDWKAVGYDGVYDRARLLSLLEQAEAKFASNAEWRDHLRDWRDAFKGAAGAALDTLYQVSSDASDALAEQLGPEPATVRVRGPRDGVKEVVLREPDLRADFDVSRDDTLVVVVFEGWSAERPPGLTLVVDWESVLLAEVPEVHGSTYTARFEGVDAGKYSAVVKPRRR